MAKKSRDRSARESMCEMAITRISKRVPCEESSLPPTRIGVSS